MRNIAPKIIAALCILSALMTTATSASAQTPQGMKIDIPFRFSVVGRTLSAGRYSVKRISQTSSAYAIQSQDGAGSVIVITTASLNGGSGEAEPRLVFNKYGGRYFLAEMWMPDSDTGNHVPQSKAERSLRRELAGTNAKPQQVALLAR